MNAKLKAKWIKALRSGKYKQARGDLALADGSLCCIGVGACVADKTFVPIHYDTDKASEILGLLNHQKERLVELNDDKKRSFKQIANYIEKHL